MTACKTKLTADEWREQPSPTLGPVLQRPTAKHPEGVAILLTMPDGSVRRLWATRPRMLRMRLRYFKQIDRAVIDALIPPGPAVQPKKRSQPKPRLREEKSPTKPTTLRDLMRKRQEGSQWKS